GLTGHGVGRTIHEPPTVPNFYDPWVRDVLTEGLVLTIEPVICTGKAAAITDDDGWTVRTKDGGLAAHHEHTLVITRGTPVLLTPVFARHARDDLSLFVEELDARVAGGIDGQREAGFAVGVRQRHRGGAIAVLADEQPPRSRRRRRPDLRDRRLALGAILDLVGGIQLFDQHAQVRVGAIPHLEARGAAAVSLGIAEGDRVVLSQPV